MDQRRRRAHRDLDDQVRRRARAARRAGPRDPGARRARLQSGFAAGGLVSRSARRADLRRSGRGPPHGRGATDPARSSAPDGPRHRAASLAESALAMLDTIPVRADERFDAARVAEFLRANGVRGRRAGGGAVSGGAVQPDVSAALGRLGGGAAPAAARSGRHRARTTWRANSASSSACTRVFRWRREPYVLCEDATVIGAPFYVMERRRGLVLDQELPAGLERRCGAASGDRRSRWCTCWWTCTRWTGRRPGWARSATRTGYMQRQVSGWIERYRARPDDDVPDVEAAHGLAARDAAVVATGDRHPQRLQAQQRPAGRG